MTQVYTATRKESPIDKQKLFKQLEYEPHGGGQWDFHNSNARFRIPCCGRRWGKSMAAGHDLTAMCFTPDSYYWIVGPNYVHGEKEFRVVYRDFVQKLGIGNKIKKSYNAKQGQMVMEFPWNTVLEVKSAEKPDSLVGEGLDGVLMSEAGITLQDPRIWQQYIQPALMDKKGWADFPSTPRGYNAYATLWEMGQNPQFPEFKSWRFPSWMNDKIFPGGILDPEIQTVKENSSEQFFNQEIAALFTTFVGRIYDEWDDTLHIDDIEYNPAWRNYWAIDFGFTAPFVCLDIMVDPSDNVYVWREYQVRYKSSWDHAHALRNRDNPEGYRVDAIFADPHGADEIAVMSPIVGYMAANIVPWKLGIEAVKRQLKVQPDGQVKFKIDRRCVETIRQMRNLQAPADTGREKNPREGQKDFDDHGADALRYFFNEYFVNGLGAGLSDLYIPGDGKGAESIFTYDNSMSLTNPVPYG